MEMETNIETIGGEFGTEGAAITSIEKPVSAGPTDVKSGCLCRMVDATGNHLE